MNINNLSSAVASTNSFEVMACSNIHVLLVEHESRDHDSIINLLHYFSYKVTSVKFLSEALSILSKGKVRYNLVMVNVNSPDSSALRLQLLEVATKMNLLVIFMSNVDDGSSRLKALEAGAFLCIRKPLSMAILEILWQLVLREKALRPRETESFTKLIDNDPDFQEEHFRRHILMKNNENYNLDGVEKETNCRNSENYSDSDCGYKRKVWTEWTLDLHNKFMAAVKFLGQGRCYPRDILEIMNVPGLTRMQVASHLQKCRNAKWLPPNERKLKGRAKRETNLRARRPLRFGLMPFWEDQKPSHFHQTIHEYISVDDDEDDDDHDHQQLLLTQNNTHGSSNFTCVLANPKTETHFNTLDLGFEFDSDKMDKKFDDYNLLDFSTNEDPFQLLSIMDSQNVHPFIPNSQQKDFDEDDDWESFLLEYGGDNHKVADEANQCFQDVINPETGNGEAEEGTERGLKV